MANHLKSSEYLSIPELARELGMSRIAVYKKVKKGLIRGVKVGRNFVISRKYLTEQINQDEHLSIPQLAKELNCSRVAAYHKVKQGIIKGRKVGKNFVVSRKSLEAEKEAFVSIPQLAKALNISRVAVYKQVKNGKINAFKIGRKFMIPRTSFEDIVLQRIKDNA